MQVCLPVLGRETWQTVSIPSWFHICSFITSCNLIFKSSNHFISVWWNVYKNPPILKHRMHFIPQNSFIYSFIPTPPHLLICTIGSEWQIREVCLKMETGGKKDGTSCGLFAWYPIESRELLSCVNCCLSMNCPSRLLKIQTNWPCLCLCHLFKVQDPGRVMVN